MPLSNIIISILLFNFCLGCATTASNISLSKIDKTLGIFHRVDKGQTLWRISKIYNVDLNELVRINKIHDVKKIEPGQVIFIPHTQRMPADIEKINKSEDFVWPLKGKVISSFGQSHNYVINKGIDIQTLLGSHVIASRSGRVSFYTENLGDLGKIVIIDHGDGFLTVYAKIGSALVNVGQNVSQGERIAKLGDDADKNQYGYLHFEIRKGHIPQNPCYYLP